MKREYGLFTRHRQEGLIWYFWYWRGGKRAFKSTGYGLREKWKAREYAEKHLSSVARADHPMPTLRQYAADFFVWDRCTWIKRQHEKGHSFSQAVAAGRRSHLVNHVFPRFGDTLLADLNAVQVETWLSSLAYTNQTRMHILNTLRIVLREAKREGLLPVNPLAEVETFSIRHERRGVFTAEELERLFPLDREKFKKVWPVVYHGIMYALMVSSGARSGEVRALPWRAVLWEQRGVLILRAITADGVIDLPKGSARSHEIRRQRAVIVPQRTVDLLAWWRTLTRWSAPDDLVFPGRGGRPLSPHTVTTYLHPGIERAKLEVEGRNIVVHSLRHTYNTRMKELLTGELYEEFTGQSLLREFTGHHSRKMTEWYDNPEWSKRLDAYGKARKQIEHFWKATK